MNKTYRNPVYAHECADPFALYYDGAFWVYRTGIASNGRIFGILRSEDLIHWKTAGGAMGPLLAAYPEYWAPEVSYHNGKFYLYYSAGNETNMHLRVATSLRPEGPFTDSGVRLTSEPFAIDAHVFTDDDGTRYMFYATDFLERERVGTGTVMDRLLDPYTLEGRPTPVSLPGYDWHIFDPHREAKGGLRWHTVEGSFVLKHKGRYYHMFSGGNYQNPTYGVGYAVAGELADRQTIDREEWEHVIDGESTLPVLRTLPGKVIGPGHNSVVLGPDHRQLFCVYHVIKPQKSFERVLAVDRLEWIGGRLVVMGPSSTPQPEPIRAECLAPSKVTVGTPDQPELTKQSFRLARADCLIDCWARSLQPGGIFGLRLAADWRSLLRVQAKDDPGGVAIMQREVDEAKLPRGFNPQALHQYQIELTGKIAAVRVDGGPIVWTGELPDVPDILDVYTEAGAAEFSTLDVTYGFEERFERSDLDLAATGWTVSGAGGARVAPDRLGLDGPARLVKDLALADYEWVVNFRLAQGERLTFYPALSADGSGIAVQLSAGAKGWQLDPDSGKTIPLPADFNPAEFQQIRFRKEAGQLRAALSGVEGGPWQVAEGETCTGLSVEAGVTAEIDLVRLTKIS